jgi:5-hydroxyisourate hydrolase-like protein (transthyretin family)
MPISHIRLRGRLLPFAAATICVLAAAGCEDDQAPQPQPAGIEIVSGDAQYTRKGTELEEPVTVRVEREDGAPAAGVDVNFQIIEGGGSLSRGTAATNASGRTSVRWTVGPDTGSNRLRITVADHSNLSATATATSSEYYCVEENPAFTPVFSPAHDMMLLTRQSSFTAGMAGLLRLGLDTQNLAFDGTSLQNYPESTFINVVRDCVFSARGDLFISWDNLTDEVMKVASDGSVSHFASLEPAPIGALSSATEIALTPEGVLVGCDVVGPFYVTCRDTLYRYEGAVFSGLGRDAANDDAVACDPTTGDLYFIYKEDRTLRRIPLDGTTVTGPIVEVVTLPIDESDGARGMVVDGDDGSVYILVESPGTKSIVRVDNAGVRTVAYDFFDRGAGDAAGVQSDLAIDRVRRFLFTLDTKNNQILLYRIDTDELFELNPSGDPFTASDAGSNERVGLDVIPGP